MALSDPREAGTLSKKVGIRIARCSNNGTFLCVGSCREWSHGGIEEQQYLYVGSSLAVGASRLGMG